MGSTWPEFEYTLGTGHASLSMHSREVSDADRKAWAWEDAAKDARRIPVGFRAPAVKPRRKKKPLR